MLRTKASSNKLVQTKGAKVHMTQERRTYITEIVLTNGTARVADLAEHFKVSEVTIRNDLDRLEKQGHLARDHGGAVSVAHSKPRRITTLLGVEERTGLNIEAKRRIAQAAARMINPGDTVLLDAGTTVVEMVRHLANIPSLTVVTNALNVALAVSASTDAHVLLLGGTLNRESCGTMGSMVEEPLGDLVVQKLFLGTQAFDHEHGLTDTTLEIAHVKRAMIRAARQVILLSDSTKWAHAGFIKVAPLTVAQTIISDTNLGDETRASIEQLGITVKLV